MIYSSKEIMKIAKACRAVSKTFKYVDSLIEPGMSTKDIDTLCKVYIRQKLNATPACLGYNGFPASVCTSVNEVAAHGIPREDHILQEGDILSLDIVVRKNGYHGDMCASMVVGDNTKFTKQQKLVDASSRIVHQVISCISKGTTVGDIGAMVQRSCDALGVTPLLELGGHGVGLKMHEQPFIPSYDNKNELELQPGMVFTIEPCISEGTLGMLELLKDNWSLVTTDKSLAAQTEYTVFIDNNYRAVPLV